MRSAIDQTMAAVGGEKEFLEICRWGTCEQLSSVNPRQIVRFIDCVGWAARNSNPSCLQWLLKPACLSKLRRWGFPDNVTLDPLCAAAAANLPENINLLLLSKVVGVNHRSVSDPMGGTALHIAFRMKHCEAATCLLRHGADPTIQDRHGNTPLHSMLTTQRVNLKLEQVLIDCSSLTYVPDLAMAAARGGSVPSFLWIFHKYKLSPTVVTQCVEKALVHKNEQVATAMLTLGLLDELLDAVLPDNESPMLVVSVMLQRVKFVELLVKKGARDLHDKDGRNAVIAATICDNCELLSFLLENGFSTTTPTRKATQVAINYHHPACLKILLCSGSPISELDLFVCFPSCLSVLRVAGLPKAESDFFFSSFGDISSEDETVQEPTEKLVSVETLQELSRECLCACVHQNGTNLFYVSKMLRLPSGLARLLLRGQIV